MVALVARSQPISAFKALGDVTRWDIMQRASAAGEISRADLQTGLRLSKPALSNHLGVLADSGLLNRRHHGRITYYSVNQDELAAATAVLNATRQRLGVESQPGPVERAQPHIAPAGLSVSAG
jgi:DNA-binding transcriptional ArsR family regulator